MDVFRNCVMSIQSPGSKPTQDEAETSFKAYVKEIVEFLTLTVYYKVSYGILTKHSLLFAFKLCTMLLMHQDESLQYSTTVRKSEWLALLRGSVAQDSELAVDSQHSSKQPVTAATHKMLKPEQISYGAWEGATLLDKALLSFSGLLTHIMHNVEMWVEFSKSDQPWLMNFDEEVVQPGPLSKSRRRSSSSKTFSLAQLNHFQRLILVNVFCTHQFAASAKWLIETEMGAEYTVILPRDLKTIYPLTGPVTPALIIIAPSEWRLCNVLSLNSSPPSVAVQLA